MTDDERMRRMSLKNPIEVEPGKWKELGECTADELEAAAGLLRELSDEEEGPTFRMVPCVALQRLRVFVAQSWDIPGTRYVGILPPPQDAEPGALSELALIDEMGQPHAP